MAKVWFVRRRAARWIAPGGKPSYELPLADLVFSLDLGPQRFLNDEGLLPEPNLPVEQPSDLKKVIVETTEADLEGLPSTAFRVGFYDSPFSPKEVARRLERLSSRSPGA